ncbi:PQQ-dependent sugar dehydrogenase [Rubrivirga sp. IMCC43871]|uniref:PQQ-dependent sugar dehydrogenase n=1 Tax=Rubrivirga sp. IMCC43871 TaxID=3391575 RepID=UPI003990163A
MRLLPLLLAALLASACTAQPTGTRLDEVMTEAGPAAVYEVATGLDHPWGMAFLPDGRMLVTERPGTLRIVSPDGTVSPPVAGTPSVYGQRQGGLLDVALDPDFETTGYVYLTYARPGPNGASATAVGRGRMVDDAIEGFEPLFTQEPWFDNGLHFGSRIAFSPDGHLFVSTGERFQFDPAQDLSTHMGKVIRLMRDGSVPADNPFVDDPDAADEIWSYGHRNVQSLGFDPATGVLWEAEFGPLGGDELNVLTPGTNYGWPIVSWGINYDGTTIPDPPTRPDLTDAEAHWSPVISPSGLTFYSGDAFPEWAGSLFLGSLSREGVVRVAVDGDTVTGQEIIPLGTRIRDVEMGPDGYLYMLTDKTDGAVWRLAPYAQGE